VRIKIILDKFKAPSRKIKLLHYCWY